MSWKIQPPSETKIIVPHLDEELAVIHPFQKGNYFKLADQISNKGYARPSFSETTSFFHASLDEKDKYSKEIKKKLKFNWFYTFNGILHTSEGIYFENDPKFKDNAQTANDLIMDEKSLKSRLGSREEKGVIFSDDGLVRFVPYEFQTGEQSTLELSRNPYIIALAEGEKQADKLAEFAGSYKFKPILFAIKNPPAEPVKKVAALVSNWNDGRLSVIGYIHGINAGGCSFGVAKNFSSGNKA